jgi:hypothetical protein
MMHNDRVIKPSHINQSIGAAVAVVVVVHVW